MKACEECISDDPPLSFEEYAQWWWTKADTGGSEALRSAWGRVVVGSYQVYLKRGATRRAPEVSRARSKDVSATSPAAGLR